MLKKIENLLTEKNIYILMAIGFLMSLIPIILLAGYNYPCADDFSASDSVRQAWLNGGSFAAVLKAAWDNVVFNYKEWSGVYMSVFFTSLQPGIFGERYYCVTTYITLFLLCVSVYYLGKVIFTRYFSTDKYKAGCIGICFLFTLIQCMPSGNEGLFWHPGTANYSWAFAFLLLLSALMLSMYKENRKKQRSKKCILSILMAVLVGGGNFITALQGCIWLVTMLGIMVLSEKRKCKKSIFQILKMYWTNVIPVITVFLAFGVSVLAPGNGVRIASSSGMNPLKAILVSFYECYTMLMEEWISFPMILLLALAIPFMWKIAGEQEFLFPYPGVIAMGAYAFASAAFTPSLYAQGSVEAGRLQNTAFFILLLMIYGLTFYIVGWIHGQAEIKTNDGGKRTKIYITGILLFFVFTLGMSIKAEEDTLTASEAAFNLLSGEAQNYKQQNEERLSMYLDENIENVVVERFVNPPFLLHFQDNTPDPADWINQAVAQYYGKESVRSEEY